MKEYILMGLSHILKEDVEYTKDEITNLVHHLSETEVQLHLYCKTVQPNSAAPLKKELIDKFFTKVYKDY